MANPEETNKRVEELRASLSPEGRALLEEFEEMIQQAGRGDYTDENRMAAQAWFLQQLNGLSERDGRTILEVLRLWSLGYFDPEEMVERALRDPEYAHRIIAQAQMLETVERGKPLRESMDIREAVEVLKRVLSEPNV